MPAPEEPVEPMTTEEIAVVRRAADGEGSLYPEPGSRRRAIRGLLATLSRAVEERDTLRGLLGEVSRLCRCPADLTYHATLDLVTRIDEALRPRGEGECGVCHSTRGCDCREVARSYGDEIDEKVPGAPRGPTSAEAGTRQPVMRPATVAPGTNPDPPAPERGGFEEFHYRECRGLPRGKCDGTFKVDSDDPKWAGRTCREVYSSEVAAKSGEGREVEWLRRLLLRYVEQEESAAPYSSSPLREESRRAIKETA